MSRIVFVLVFVAGLGAARPAQGQNLDSLIRVGAKVRVRTAELGSGWHLGRFVFTTAIGGGEVVTCPSVAPRENTLLASFGLGLVDSLEVWVGDGTPDLNAGEGWRSYSRDEVQVAGQKCRRRNPEGGSWLPH